MKNPYKKQKWTVLATALTLAALLAAAGPALADRPAEGEPAPNFTLNDIYGAPHSLAGYLGRIVVLAFFSDT